MSYVQGTTVELVADFYNPTTRAAVTPTEIVLTIDPPNGPSYIRTLSAGEIVADLTRPGRYLYRLDTEPAPGTWRYQFEDPSPNASVLGRKEITVTSRLPLPT